MRPISPFAILAVIVLSFTAGLSVLAASEPTLEVTLAGYPLDDSRIQQAILAAVPWRDLTDTVFKQWMTIPVTGWREDNEISQDAGDIHFEPSFTRQLLAESGFQDGFSMYLLYYPADRIEMWKMASLLVDMLSEIGIRVNQVSVKHQDDINKMIKQIVSGKEPDLSLTIRTSID